MKPGLRDGDRELDLAVGDVVAGRVDVEVREIVTVDRHQVPARSEVRLELDRAVVARDP